MGRHAACGFWPCMFVYRCCIFQLRFCICDEIIQAIEICTDFIPAVVNLNWFFLQLKFGSQLNPTQKVHETTTISYVCRLICSRGDDVCIVVPSALGNKDDDRFSGRAVCGWGKEWRLRSWIHIGPWPTDHCFHCLIATSSVADRTRRPFMSATAKASILPDHHQLCSSFSS
jgi:hypothetical protein